MAFLAFPVQCWIRYMSLDSASGTLFSDVDFEVVDEQPVIQRIAIESEKLSLSI